MRQGFKKFNRRAPRILALVVLLGVVVAGAARAQEAAIYDSGWTALSTAHFTLYTNADLERGAEIVLGLERFRAAFAELAPALELSSPVPTKILAFRDAAAYAPYKTAADRGGATILGQFLSHRDGNYITLDAGEKRVGSFAVIYHEFVHYFVRHNFPRVPLWFNEGLAEYYSTFTIDGGEARIGQPVERHVRFLQKAEEIHLDDVLAAGSSGTAHDAERVGELYAVSWALVHYLLSGGGERLDRVADYFLALDDGEAPDDAFEDAFGARLGTLEEALRQHVQAGELPSASIPVERLPARVEARAMTLPEVLYHLGDLVAHMGRIPEAEQHHAHALALEPSHLDAVAGLAYVRDLQSRFEEAEVLYRQAIDGGTRNPLTYLHYARHLLTLATARENAALPHDAAAHEAVTAQAERARWAARKVVDLDPDFAEGYAVYGQAHLVGEATPGDGIRALEHARELLPTRMDIVYHLVQLHLKDRQGDRARALVEGVLARYAEPELVFQAREEVERMTLLQAAEDALNAGETEEGLRLYDEAVSVTSDPELRSQMEEKLLALQAQFTGVVG